MGREQELKEAKRWLAQAEDDLSASTVLLNNAKYTQACFLCQQAGEKSLKAIWFYKGLDPWGHSLLKLIEDFEEEVMRAELESFRGEAILLDRLYIPTRYPNGLPEITPMQAYTAPDVEAAMQAASRIMQFVKKRTGV